MRRKSRYKIAILIELMLLLCLTGMLFKKYWDGAGRAGGDGAEPSPYEAVQGPAQGVLQETPNALRDENGIIQWVDFNIPYESLSLAYDYDVKSFGQDRRIDWIALLAYGAARNGGNFNKEADEAMKSLAERIGSGDTTMEEETGELANYDYYEEAYRAALGGMVGEYLIQEPDDNGQLVWRKKYGLKCFSPIAKGFPYTDYDDFGSSRSYGYARPHLGHDMMGQVGTPLVAVESGYVEALGWNQYGGWRIGIRSFDGKRYYYYAHMRQDYPYAEGLEVGSVVTAGDVIGYMGHTGYSKTENVNNIKTVHLHWGLELVFDESQKESDNEIWVDCYQLSKFLYLNRSEAAKQEGTKEWKRIYDMEDPEAERFLEEHGGSVSGNGTSDGEGNEDFGDSVSGNSVSEEEEGQTPEGEH